MADRDDQIIARVRHVYDAFNRGDFDAAIEVAHPDIEVVRTGGQPPIIGADGLRAWMEPDAFEMQVFEPLDFSVEGNKVLVRQHGRARGAGSGIEMEAYGWSVWTLDDAGLATRLEFFDEHEQAAALEAAGLRA